jgi:nucleoside-diphosphate-sugar epimerase
MAVINPGYVLGPSLSKRVDGTSVESVIDMLSGKYSQGLPELWFGTVDVRDVAIAHIQAALHPRLTGRFILVAEAYSMPGIAAKLSEICGKKYPVPRRKVPKSLVYITGPFLGLTWKYISRNVDVPVNFDNNRSLIEMGLKYRPLSETLKDQVNQLEMDGILTT